MEPMADASAVERMLMEKSKLTGNPIYGCLELTPLCNMDCQMCYVRMSRSEMESQGCLRSSGEWLELGRQMKEAGTLFLLLTGGEPLAHPDFKSIYLGLRQMGMILTVNTNGTLLDEEWAEFFSQNHPRRINITLYGKDKDTYRNLCKYEDGFERAIRAIKLLKDRNVDVKINAIAAKANAEDIKEIIDIGEQLDAPVRTDCYMMPAERERCKPYDLQSRLEPEKAAQINISSLKQEMPPDLFRQYVDQSLDGIKNFIPSDQPRGMSCYAGNCSFTVNWQGNLRPCVVMSGPSANVFEQGFLPAWQTVRSECQKIRLNIRCSQCNLRPVCRTCPACALLETGSYQGVPDYMCRYAEESYRLIKKEAEGMQHE